MTNNKQPANTNTLILFVLCLMQAWPTFIVYNVDQIIVDDMIHARTSPYFIVDFIKYIQTQTGWAFQNFEGLNIKCFKCLKLHAESIVYFLSHNVLRKIKLEQCTLTAGEADNGEA